MCARVFECGSNGEGVNADEECVRVRETEGMKEKTKSDKQKERERETRRGKAKEQTLKNITL